MYKIRRKNIHKPVLALIVFIVITVIFLRLTIHPALAAWYDDTYAYRKTITFTYNSAISTERRVTIAIDTAALTTDKMQADCDDTRFTNGTGTSLRFQLVSGCDTSSTSYDVVMPTLNNGSNLIYFYYGNPAASSASTDVSSITSVGTSSDTGLLTPGATGEDHAQWSGCVYTAVTSSDNTYCQDSTNGYRQDFYNYGFSIPGGASITGIGVVMEAGTGNDTIGDGISAELSWNGGTSYTTSFYTSGGLTTTDATYNIGGASITWGRTWSDTEFSNANFRLRLQGDIDTLSFLPGSQVLLGNGSTVSVETLLGNEEILSYNTDSQTLITNHLTSVTKHTINSYYILNHDSKVTGNELIYAKKPDQSNFSWIRVDNLSINDIILKYTPNKVSETIVFSLEPITKTVDVYTVKATEPYNNYWVDGYLYDPPLGNTVGVDLLQVRIYYTTGVTPTFGSEEQGPSPVSYWSFDEASGSTANDYSTGSNNDLTITNAAWKSEDFCVSGKCLYFDGNADRATKSYSSDTELLPSTTSFTVTTWFKHGSTAGADTLISRADGVNGVGWKTYMNSSGYMCFGIDQTAGTFPNDDACTTTSYADSKWHYLAAVKNSTTNIQIYIDNALVDTQTGITASSISGTNAPFTVGNDFDNGTNGWVGFIDEVKYYNFAKTTTQLQTEFASRGASKGTSVQFGTDINKSLSDGLVGYWKLEESSTGAGAVTRNDSSGNDNNLTDNNTTASGAGKFGTGADLETASNESLTIQDNNQTGLDLSTTFTLATWFKPESLSYGCTSCAGGLIVKRPSSGGGTEWAYVLEVQGDGVSSHFLGAQVAPNSTSGTEYISGTTALSTGTWYHGAFVFDKGKVTLYLNGNIQASSTFSFTSAYNSDLDFGVGYSINDTFDGVIDDARVYNRALSTSEIQALYNIPPGPVAHWKMDANLGTSTTVDSSGNDNNGTLSGITNSKWAAGKFGSALTFTAAGGESINAGSATVIDQLPALTAEAWVYPTSFTNNAIVFMKASGLSTNGWDFVILNSGKLEFAVDYTTGNTLTFQTTTALTLNQWNHIAVTWDGSTTVANAIPYINGVRVTQFDTQTAGGTTRIDDSSQSLILAGDGAGSNIDGKVDDFRLYNYVRTPSQIVEDMNASHPPGGSPIASQVLYWSFDEGQGTTANNSGYAPTSNGTLTSIAAPATSTSGWTPSGKVNKGIVFDGSNDNVLLATADDAAVDFNGSEPFTLSAWVYPTTMASTNERDAIISKWDTTGTQRDYRLTLTNDDADATGNFRVEVYDESADQTISASGANDTVSVNTWYHVTATFNGGTAGTAGDLKLYVNGLLTSSNSANASFLGLEDQAADFTVGDYDTGDANAANTAFTGTIDEVKVYSSELSANDIAIDKNANSAIALGGVLGTQDNEGFGGNPPLAYWKFDENGGSTVYDSSGYNNSSTGFALAFWSTGKYGHAIESNNSGTGIKVNDNSSLDITDSYTISAWIYKTASLTGTCGEIVQKGNGTNSANFFLDLCDNSGNDYLGTGFYNGAWKDLYDTTTPIPNNQWTHVAGVFSNSADLFTLYINGRAIRNDPETSTLATNNLRTAIFSDDTDNFDFTGRIDELKIYDYARTPAQIAYDFNRGAPLAIYSFDECSGDTAYNSAPAAAGGARGLNGTLTYGGTGNTSSGDCTTSTTSMRYNGRNGKYSAGLDFDGTNDSVDMNDQNEFDIGPSITDLPSTLSVSAWIYRDTTGTIDTIVSKYDGVNIGTGGWAIGIDDTDDIFMTFEHPSPSVYRVDSAKTITSTGWHHIVATFDRSSVSNTNIYIDGILDVQNRSGTLSTITDISNSDDFRIGSLSDGSDPFDGQIDEVRFYTYPLSATQVQKLYNEGAAVRFGPVTGSP